MAMEQCDDGMASSDGDVYYIRTFDATDDYDLDGCTNERELQIVSGSQTSGGLRDPANPWDFYDTNGDRQISLTTDILGVISRWQTYPGGPPDPGSGLYYNLAYDRGPSEGPYAWNMTAPDDYISLTIDILGVILQWQHNCN